MRLSTSIALAATLAACGGTEPSGLRLDITVDKSAVASTDSVRVGLRLTNMSTRTVKVTPAEAYGICYRAFEVFDAHSRPVLVAGGFCLAALTIAFPQPIDLAPGQQIAIQDWWQPSTSQLDGHPLTPGTYRLRGRATSVDGSVHSGLRSVALLD